MESGRRLSECVLESDDVEVAMVTSEGGEGRGGEETLRTSKLGCEPVASTFKWLCMC